MVVMCGHFFVFTFVFLQEDAHLNSTTSVVEHSIIVIMTLHIGTLFADCVDSCDMCTYIHTNLNLFRHHALNGITTAKLHKI